MIIVKELSSFNSKSYYFDKEQINCSSWFINPRTKIVPSFYCRNDLISVDVYRCLGIIENGYIEFEIGAYKLVIDANIPNDLIQYTKCFFIAPKTKIEKTVKNNYEITTQGMIRFIFNGSKEDALIWRLSI